MTQSRSSPFPQLVLAVFVRWIVCAALLGIGMELFCEAFRYGSIRAPWPICLRVAARGFTMGFVAASVGLVEVVARPRERSTHLDIFVVLVGGSLAFLSSLAAFEQYTYIEALLSDRSIVAAIRDTLDAKSLLGWFQSSPLDFLTYFLFLASPFILWPFIRVRVRAEWARVLLLFASSLALSLPEFLLAWRAGRRPHATHAEVPQIASVALFLPMASRASERVHGWLSHLVFKAPRPADQQ